MKATVHWRSGGETLPLTATAAVGILNVTRQASHATQARGLRKGRVIAIRIGAHTRLGKPAGGGPEHLWHDGQDVTLCGREWAPGWLMRIETVGFAADLRKRGELCRTCLKAEAKRRRGF